MATTPLQTTRRFSGRFVGVALLTVLACAGSGCASRGNVDLLEARLRQQEDSLHQMQSNLASVQGDLAAARMESDALRTQLAAQGKKTLLSEQANTLYSASTIEIDRFRSGGLDNDGEPGDELITAAVVPRDRDGELLKLAGAIEIEVLDLAKPADQQRLGVWNYDATQSSEYWQRNFLGSGYFFKLPLKQPPQNSQLVLHATLTAADGRRFDANETIKVNVATADLGKTTEVVNDSERNRAPAASVRMSDQFEKPAATKAANLNAPPIAGTATPFGDQSRDVGRASVARSKAVPSELNPAGASDKEPAQIQQLNFAPEVRTPALPGGKRFDLTPGTAGDRKVQTPVWGRTDATPSNAAPGSSGNAFKPEAVQANKQVSGIPEWAREDADLLAPTPARTAKPRPANAPATSKASPPDIQPAGAEVDDIADAAPLFELKPDTTGDRKARSDSSLPAWAR